MHDEIEQAGPGREHSPDGGTHAEPERWHVVNIFNADAVPMPLTFDTLEQARTYVARTSGRLRSSARPSSAAASPKRPSMARYSARPARASASIGSSSTAR